MSEQELEILNEKFIDCGGWNDNLVMLFNKVYSSNFYNIHKNFNYNNYIGKKQSDKIIQFKKDIVASKEILELLECPNF